MTYSGLLTKENMPENGIFVFGSNPLGINGNPKKGTGGAALVAHLQFGVKQGEIMNNCLSESKKAYGLTTVKAPKIYLPINEIIENIKKLYKFASENTNNVFYIAYSGKDPNKFSLNGQSMKSLGKLFFMAGLDIKIPKNIVFEENFSNLVFNLEKGFDF